MATIKSSLFGKTCDGEPINIFTLVSDTVQLGIIEYGAAITFLKVPDKSGEMDDIVTGFDTMPEYIEKSTYFGCAIGRVANRIAQGKFSIDGKEYSLELNNGPNTNHGGFNGFDKKLWKGEIAGESVLFRLVSPDGDEGFPGEMNVVVSYTLHDNQLVINYHATCDKPTLINMTNHSFFNLGGHNNWEKNLSNHEICIPADEYLPTDENCLVTGKVELVEGTVFDLRKPIALTEDLINQVPGLGFDHNFCVEKTKERHLLAVVKHTTSGRMMMIESTEPGVQLYTGNFLNGIIGKRNAMYTKHSAMCIESQNWPDAVNHPGVFPENVLRPGDEYNHTIWIKFKTC